MKSGFYYCIAFPNWFSTQRKDNSTNLYWVKAIQQNRDRNDILRSVDGTAWKKFLRRNQPAKILKSLKNEFYRSEF